MTVRAAFALSVVLAGALAPPAPAQSDVRPTGLDPSTLTALDLELQDAIERGRFERAKSLGETILAERPKDPFVRYDYARALGALGEGEAAAEALLDAIAYGLTDFHRMEHDPLLGPARASSRYAAIRLGWRQLLDARGERNFEQLKERFGDAYAYATDEALRLHYASSVDETSFAEARREVDRVTRFARLLFPARPEGEGVPDRPHAWVSVVIPTPSDFFRLLRMAGVGGVYEDRTKRLITRDIGPGLRHEYFHVLHHRHMAELGQQHALWVMEGLACLVEDVSDDPEAPGGLKLEPSWRTNIAGRLARSGALMPLDRFVRLDRAQFVVRRARAKYAQARAVCMYLHERGVLDEWYRAYTEGFGDDPTGLTALETVLGEPVREIDRAFRVWARAAPEVGEANRGRGAALGFEVSTGPADGLRLEEHAGRDSVVEGERPRRGDVILAIDDERAPTRDDLYRLLGERSAGDTVRLTVRRGDRRFEAVLRLAPARDAFGF